MSSKSIALAIFVSGIALGNTAHAQSGEEMPDFSGLWSRAYLVDQTFDPPPSGPGPILQDMRYPGVNITGELRGPITEEERANVVRFINGFAPDTSNPILQPHTKAALDKIAENELAGIPRPQPQTRCMPSGVPHILNSGDPIMILQTPDEVLILYSRDHHVRHVYLNRPHSENLDPTWWGSSVGHYEGDTLVVDTVAQTDIPDTDRFGTPHSEQIHVVERYRLSDDKTRLEVLFTVEDPIAFTMPWSARADYRVNTYMFLENVCAENPRDFWPGIPIIIPIDSTPDF